MTAPLEVTVLFWRAATAPARLAALAALLSAEERARAARFATTALSDRFIAHRGRLRELIAAHLSQGGGGVDPSALRFALTPTGKPVLNPVLNDEEADGGAAARDPLHFNLSHCGALAALALAAAPVGVDIEQVRPIEPGAMALALAPEEAARLREASGAEAKAMFFRAWTLKEAFLKGDGAGLTRNPAALRVALEPPPQPAQDQDRDPNDRRLLSADWDAAAPARWRLTCLTIPASARAAPGAPPLIGALAAACRGGEGFHYEARITSG
ncbi:MAG: 4'-phosphopantetheinyl transferase superfamily protein [Pseudomonadota bacterium]